MICRTFQILNNTHLFTGKESFYQFEYISTCRQQYRLQFLDHRERLTEEICWNTGVKERYVYSVVSSHCQRYCAA